MARTLTPAFWVLPVCGALLMAADPAWISKPIPGWSKEDAQQVLTSSPWSKSVVAAITRRETEDELRAGGEMGQRTGVGYDGVDDKRPKAQFPIQSIGDMVKPKAY